jgi:hypothetical protein
VVGQQVTLDSTNAATLSTRLDLFNNQAFMNCDLVVKGVVSGEERGWYKAGTMFRSDRASEPLLSDGALRALAATPGQDLTYTCVPRGSGARIGVDRDEDGAFDRDELDAGTDPADPNSIPPTPTPTLTPTPTSTFTPTPTFGCGNPGSIDRARVRVARNANPAGDERLTVQGEVVMPPINPNSDGFRFQLEDQGGAIILVRDLPGGSWSLNRTGTRWTYYDGFVRVTIQDKTARTPGLYKVRVTAKNSDYQVAPGEIPVRLLMLLGTGPTQCARRNFNPSGGAAPACELASNGNTLNCR